MIRVSFLTILKAQGSMNSGLLALESHGVYQECQIFLFAATDKSKLVVHGTMGENGWDDGRNVPQARSMKGKVLDCSAMTDPDGHISC